MQILYIANDRRAAELAGSALRTPAPGAVVAWAAGLGDARRWIADNRDVAAIIIELAYDQLSWESFVGQVRGLGVTAPVIVVSDKDLAASPTRLGAAVDGVVTKGPSFLEDLGATVSRVLHTSRPPAHPARRRLRLLYVGDAALARECLGRPGSSIEVIAAAPGPARTFDHLPLDVRPGEPPPFDVMLIEHGAPGVETLAILKDMAARKLQVPAVIVADWDEELAAPALRLGASDYVAKSRASFRAVYFRLNRLIAHSALLNEQSRLRDAHAAAVDQARASRADLERQLAEPPASLENAERRLQDAVAALGQLRQDRSADALAAAEDRARRDADFSARFAEATAIREKIERQLAGGNAALQHAERRAAIELRTASQDFARRQTELEAALAEEAAQRRVLERKLAEGAESHHAAEQHRIAESDRLAHEHGELTTRLTQAVQARDRFELRMNDAVAALEQARHDRAADAAAAAEHLARRKATLISELGKAAAAQERLELRLVDADTALRWAEQRAATEHTARQQAADRQAHVEAALAGETATRAAIEQQLADTMLALQRAEERHASEITATEARFAEHQARYDAHVSDAAAAQDALQARLAASELASQRAEEQHASEITAIEARFAEHQARHDAHVSEAAAAQDALQARLAASELASQRAEEQHASEITAIEARFAEHQARHEAQVSEAVAAQDALQARLAASELASQRAEEQQASEMTAAAAQLADHQRQAETRWAEAVAVANSLEVRLADAAAALQRAEERAVLDSRTAIKHAVRREAEFDAQLAEELAARQVLVEQVADTTLALQRAEARHASEISAAAAQLVEHRQHAEAQRAQAAADATAALEAAEQQAAAERQAAAVQAAEVRTQLGSELGHEIARRQAIEGELVDTRTASEQARLRLLDEASAADRRAREHESRLEERTARERCEWDSARLEAEERIRHLQIEGDLARQALVVTEERVQRLESVLEAERARFGLDRMAIEADLAHQRTAHMALRQTLDETRAVAHDKLQQASRDFLAERLRLEALVADRDRHAQEQAARTQASHEAAAATLAGVEHRLHVALAAGDRDSGAIAELQQQLGALGGELDATRGQLDALKTVADRVPQLRRQIDDIRGEHRRQFDRTPVSACRCRPDGAIAQVNRALATLLGYNTPEELQKVNFAGTVFESGDELQWLVDRCVASRSTESIETTWKRKDGSRIIVRVLAAATAADSIDLAAEDITTVRVLEEKLRNSQRMEAVGRYGSEVAVTCHNLLRHVKQEGQQWLDTVGSDTARHQGALLLDEVTRAEGFLRQLTVYGNEQKNTPELVDVNSVLRDLEPVLKRVAGGNVELVLPKPSTPLNLDVDPERVERILVNVAAYGRERMPHGGRLKIEVAAVTVDREFVAKYPNVRPGGHVLLTVNEVRGEVRPGLSEALRGGAAAADAAADNPGVDLGALQALVTDCGGHLWIMAEPPGHMVLKIHLPRRALDRPDSGIPAKRAGHARWINRVFGVQH